jgi:Secretion system C-terminal sorting domain
MLHFKAATKIRFCFFLIFSLSSSVSLSQVNVLTQHNNVGRTGWNDREKILTTKNVKAGSFGLLFSRTVDDQMYAQPLVMSGVSVPGVGSRNIVFAATVNNSVYAFDADAASPSAPYWQANLTPGGSRPVRNTDMTGACGGNYKDFSGNIGIVSTPVIDSVTNTMYVVARSVTSSLIFHQFIHALDITTGQERPFSPVEITASISSHGDGSVSGMLTFDPQKQNQRSGLLLSNGIVYLAWASHCDWGPYHGWIMGYDAATLQQKCVFNVTPEGYNGGIWMSGGGPSADESGNLYAAVGNGSVGLNGDPTNLTNRSESALKLTPSGSTLVIDSYFTPSNYPTLEQYDLDFGVTQVLLIPGTTRAVTGCKDGFLFLVDRDNMGGYSIPDAPLQSINLGANAYLRSSLSYYRGSKEYVYVFSENSTLHAYPFNRNTGEFDLLNAIGSVQGPVGNNGALLCVSSNGSVDSTAILWASHAANGDANQDVRPGILRAFSAADITQEIWNSSIFPTDNPGNYAKFNCPTIANGKVYLATFSSRLAVYGLTGGPVDGLKPGSSTIPIVYPNAANQTVHIVRGEEIIRTINVYDLSGRLVLNYAPSPESAIDLPLGIVTSGIYILELITPTTIYRQKLLVQH